MLPRITAATYVTVERHLVTQAAVVQTASGQVCQEAGVKVTDRAVKPLTAQPSFEGVTRKSARIVAEGGS